MEKLSIKQLEYLWNGPLVGKPPLSPLQKEELLLLIDVNPKHAESNFNSFSNGIRLNLQITVNFKNPGLYAANEPMIQDDFFVVEKSYRGQTNFKKKIKAPSKAKLSPNDNNYIPGEQI